MKITDTVTPDMINKILEHADTTLSQLVLLDHEGDYNDLLIKYDKLGNISDAWCRWRNGTDTAILAYWHLVLTLGTGGASCNCGGCPISNYGVDQDAEGRMYERIQEALVRMGEDFEAQKRWEDECKAVT